ncbi:hypothetical protein DVS28_a4814 [Euzebya pacifica]|uniref:Helix-turn-helix domain-containing protein n=1 Tax=Euzebya pacifica TaxID=1608957 RepID=A0A346Y4S5_9ACTN|nr:hypothetical protein DVS28_a4814 [Euzebya pacifica]
MGWSTVSGAAGQGRDGRDRRTVGSTEAAARLGMSVRALQRLAGDGRLGVKDGGRWMFSTAELEAFVDDQQTPATAGPVESAVAGMVAELPVELRGTPRAALVVVLARRLDGTEAARDSAALSRELREALAQLEDDAGRVGPAEPSPVQQLLADVARSRADRTLRAVTSDGTAS